MFRESETNLTSRLISEPSSGETSETLLSTILNLLVCNKGFLKRIWLNRYCNIFQITGVLESGNHSRQTLKHWTRQTEEHIRRSVATCEEGVAGRQSQVFKKKKLVFKLSILKVHLMFSRFLLSLIWVIWVLTTWCLWRWSWSRPLWLRGSPTDSWWLSQGGRLLRQ